MVLCDDCECSVCLLRYSRMDRIPRVLHCRHTFCEPCLEAISRVRSGHLAVPCPLCRRVTCIGPDRRLQDALWVDPELWERIRADLPEERWEGGAAEQRVEAKQQPALQDVCISSRSGTRFKLPTFFRRFSWTRPQRDTIIPDSNVEMKSWRRLSADDIL